MIHYDHPILGLDIDGVLADFVTAYIDAFITHTGKNLFPPRPFPWTDWEHQELCGYTPADSELVWSKLNDSTDFWEQLNAYSDIDHTIRLANHFPTYFITSRNGHNVKGQTERWLSRHGVLHPTVLISSHKGLCCKALGITHYVDDRTENCESVVADSPTTACTMIAQPWNRQIPNVPRLPLAVWTSYIDRYR